MRGSDLEHCIRYVLVGLPGQLRQTREIFVVNQNDTLFTLMGEAWGQGLGKISLPTFPVACTLSSSLLPLFVSA